MAESGPGGIVLFNDFTGVANLLAETTDTIPLGDFFAGGEGIEDTDAGVANLAGLSGILRVTSANDDADTTFVGTNIMFDVGLMGTLVLEARVQLPDLDTKEIFFGLTSILILDTQLADIVANSSATALTLTADLCGFYLSDELTDDEDWHGIYNGGTAAAGGTTTADVDLDTDAVAGEWQILRLEVDANGDARWFIDGVLKQSVAGACSTTSDFAVVFACGANTTELVIADLDYLLVKANRDWTV